MASNGVDNLRKGENRTQFPGSALTVALLGFPPIQWTRSRNNFRASEAEEISYAVWDINVAAVSCRCSGVRWRCPDAFRPPQPDDDSALQLFSCRRSDL